MTDETIQRLLIVSVLFIKTTKEIVHDGCATDSRQYDSALPSIGSLLSSLFLLSITVLLPKHHDITPAALILFSYQL
jgi:hypothetical protein